LPDVSHFANLVQIKIGNHELIRISRRLGNDLSARVAKVTLAVELADVPWLLVPDPIDCADEVAVGNRVRRLFELPKVFRKSRDGRRWIEDDLRAIKHQSPSAFGEMPVITNVDADPRESRLKGRVAEITGFEVVLLPEPRFRVRYV